MIRPDPIDHAGDYPGEFIPVDEQPHGVEIHIVDDVFVKQMVIPKAGTFVPQHVHGYDHLSMLAVGSVVVWRNEANPEICHAPKGITIKAGVRHTFKSLKDNTIIYCIHNAARAELLVEIEPHRIVGAD